MKNIFKTLLLGTLGVISMTSCGGNKVESSTPADTTEQESSKTEESSSTYEKNEFSYKTDAVYLEGFNKTFDLADCFEFKGKATINALKFDFFDMDSKGSEIVNLNGHTVTSIGYGSATILTEENPDSGILFYDALYKTITVNVIKEKDMVGSFRSANEGTANWVLDTKDDGTFKMERTAGNYIPLTGDPKEVTSATLTGTYKIQSTGVFKFTLDATSKQYGADFTGYLVYDKRDGSEYHLSVEAPLNKDDILLGGITFNINK